MIPIELSSIRNIRDLGGIKTADGRSIRPGCLIRSAHLGHAVPEDLEKLRKEHRLRTVLDLRTAQERQEQPDQTGGLEYLPLPIIEDLKAGITHEQQSESKGFPDMAYLYQEMMSRDNNQAGFRRVLTAIFTHDYGQGAILWHCTEGKDRCGLTSALVLEILGVDRETIRKDYLKTNLVNLPKAEAIRERMIPERGKKYADRIYQAYIADERYLQAAWDTMGENYISDVLGIPDESIRVFRAAVLESPRIGTSSGADPVWPDRRGPD